MIPYWLLIGYIETKFYECKNFDFVSSKDLAIFNHKETNSVKLKNPLNEDWQYLRPTLLNGLIKNINIGFNCTLVTIKIKKRGTSENRMLIKPVPIVDITNAVLGK